MSELLPCPFCGSDDLTTAYEGRWVWCCECFTECLAEIWNTRAPFQYTTEPTEAMIEAGRKANSEHGGRSIYRGIPFAEIYKAMLAASPVDTEDR